MKNLTTILILLFSLFTATTAVEWEEIKCDVKARPSAVFNSGDTIYIGHYGIAKSSDGGKTFKKINKVVDGDRVYDLAEDMCEVYEIFQNKFNVLFAKAVGKKILYSTNGGELWQTTNLDLTERYNFIFNEYYTSDSYIYIFNRTASPDSLLYKSNDLGKTWSSCDLGIKQWKKIESIEYLSSLEKFCIVGLDQNSKQKIFYYDANKNLKREIDIELPNFEDPKILCSGNHILAYNKTTHQIYKYNIKEGWKLYIDLIDTFKMLHDVKVKEINLNKAYFLQTGDTIGFNISFKEKHFWDFLFDNEEKQVTIYSTDYGNTWEEYDYFKVNYITRFTPYDISKITNIIKYRRYKENQLCVRQNSGLIYTGTKSQKVWYKIENGDWVSIPNIYKIWPDYDGSAYVQKHGGNEYDSLFYYENWCSIDQDADYLIAECLVGDFIFGNFCFDHIVNHKSNIVCVKKHGLSGHINKYNGFHFYFKNEVIAFFDNKNRSIVLDEATGDYCSVVGDHEVPIYVNPNIYDTNKVESVRIMLGNYKSHELKEIRGNILTKYFKNILMDFEKQTIIFSHTPGIEISRDIGETWTKILDLPKEEIDLKLHDENTYLKTNKLLLRSHDGKNWENILEGTSKAKIIDFEFDPDDYAYVYTTNGAFISSEKMTDATEAWEEDKIDFDFSISSDKKTLQISGSDKINNISVSESDLELKRISESNFDISNLEAQNYFLRVQLEDGKVVYKQLVLAAE